MLAPAPNLENEKTLGDNGCHAAPGRWNNQPLSCQAPYIGGVLTLARHPAGVRLTDEDALRLNGSSALASAPDLTPLGEAPATPAMTTEA
jgi:hypothetical protein